MKSEKMKKFYQNEAKRNNDEDILRTLELLNEFDTINENEIFKIQFRRKVLGLELDNFVRSSLDGTFRYCDLPLLLDCIKSARKETIKVKNKKIGYFQNELRDMESNCFCHIAPYIAKYYGVQENEICFSPILYTSDYRIDTICPYKVMFDNTSFNWNGEIVRSTGKLKYVFGTLSLYNIDSVPNLIRVENNLNAKCCKAKNINSLKYVGGDFIATNTILENLDNLEFVGGGFYLKNSKIKNLDNLKYVGGTMDLRNTSICDLKNLKFVGGNLFFNNIDNIINVQNLKVDGKIYYLNGKNLNEIELKDLKEKAKENDKKLTSKNDALMDNINNK